MKERKSFLLRLNPDLYQNLEAWAQQEFRSVNGQIEFILREAIKKHRVTGSSKHDAVHEDDPDLPSDAT